jgi:sulfofructose kinase
VNTEGFKLFDGARSSVSGVFVDREGERHIINFRGQGLPDTADWLPLEKIASADAVLSDPRWPDGAEAAFAAARRAGVPTVLDAEVADAEIFERLLPLTDHAIFSEPALAGFAGSDIDAALKRIERRGCRVSAVTLGERGVEWREGGEVHRLPAFAVAVVDTNGAGDVFHGAYAFALGAGMAVEEAMAFASAAAALKCAKPAGRGGIPTLDEITAFQRTTT